MRRLMSRFRHWLHSARVDAEIEAEMRDHVAREIEDRVARGESREEATRRALADFGGVERFKEEARDVVGLRALDDLDRDVRYALRLLRRNPAFTVAVALTFALGIGCTAAIFTLVNGILLRPLPYQRPTELVALWERNIPRAVDRNVVSSTVFDQWRLASRSLSAVAAMVPAPLTLKGNPAERITGAQVSPSYFRLLGVNAALGRVFTDADETGGGQPVTILSDALWRSRFSADPNVVGRQIVLDGTAYTIVGVMPPDFEPPRFGWMTEHPLWIPFAPTPSNKQWGRFLHVIARLRPGVTPAQAQAELATISDRLAHAPEGNAGWSATVVRLDEQITGDVRRPLLALFAAVSLLLLISVVNVANLVAIFTRRREPELALRQAIGATPWRLWRQQLALSVTLGSGATLIAVVVAGMASRGLVVLMASTLPRLDGARLDTTGVAFILGAACLTTAVVAWRSAAGLAGGIERDQLASARATRRLSGGSLVTVEIAVGLVLTLLAVLMVRSVVNLSTVDLGFQPANVVTARVSLPTSRYPGTVQQRQFFEALRARARALPGVTAASVATTAPLNCCAPSTTARDARHLADPRAASPTTDVRFVDDAYFTTLQIPLLRGETFPGGEPSEGQPRVVISRALARALWGEANPLGQRLALTLFGTTIAEVIGVVGDVRYTDARTPPRPAAYLSVNRFPSNERDIVVRGVGDDNTMIAALRTVLRSADEAIPLYRAAALTHTVDETYASERVVTALLSAFAALALLLAAVGVHGVLSADVARRRREIGIRVALGAAPLAVYRMVLGRITTPALGGIGIGVVGAMLLSRIVSALVFGVTTTDVLSFVAVVVSLALVALVATWLPAFRATRVSPVEAIRTE